MSYSSSCSYNYPGPADLYSKTPWDDLQVCAGPRPDLCQADPIRNPSVLWRDEIKKLKLHFSSKLYKVSCRSSRLHPRMNTFQKCSMFTSAPGREKCKSTGAGHCGQLVARGSRSTGRRCWVASWFQPLLDKTIRWKKSKFICLHMLNFGKVTSLSKRLVFKKSL